MKIGFLRCTCGEIHRGAGGHVTKKFFSKRCLIVTSRPLISLGGKTLNVYKKPENLTSAKVFSDPPINIAEISKSGEMFKIKDNNAQWKSNIKIKDGNYKIGIRPHNITTYKEGNNSVEIDGKVLISEISGSESLIHFTSGKLNWVSLSNGIQQKNIGEHTKLFMNVDEFLYFDTNNRLVSNG